MKQRISTWYPVLDLHLILFYCLKTPAPASYCSQRRVSSLGCLAAEQPSPGREYLTPRQEIELKTHWK